MTTEANQGGELTGRELSAEMAVRFLGHKWLRDRDDKFRESEAFLCGPENLPKFEDRYVEADEKWPRKSRNFYWAQDPASSIADAMEVWDRLISLGFLPRLLTMVDGYVVNLHRKEPGNFHVVQVEAHTREVAICRAAAAAMKEASK